MNRFRSLCLLIVLVAAISTARAQAPKLFDVPPSNAFVCVGVSDTTQLRAQWAKTPIAQLWKDPAVQQFTAPGRKKFAEWWSEKLAGNEALRDKWVAYFPGPVVFFIDAMIWHEDLGEMEIPLCFAGKIGLPREEYMKFINDFMAKLPPDAAKSQYEVNGVQVRMAKYTQEFERDQPASPFGPSAPQPATPSPVKVPCYFQYAFAGDVLLITDGEEAIMRRMVNRLQKPVQDSLLNQPSIKRTRALLADPAQIIAYCDLKQAVGAWLKDTQAQQPIQLVNLKALGLQELGGLAAAISLSEQKVASALALDLPQTGPGVVGIVRQLRPSPLRTAALTPGSALSYDSFAANWVGLYDEIRNTIKSVVPMADAGLAMGISNFETEQKISIRGILNAFGEEVGYCTLTLPKEPNDPKLVFLIAVKDAKYLQQSIDTLLQTAQGWVRVTPSEFLGFQIRSATPVAPPGEAAPGPMISWVFTNDFVILGDSTDALKEVLQFKAGRRTDSFAATPIYRQARAALPPKVDGLGIQNTGALAETLLGKLAEIARQPGFQGSFGEIFDTSRAIPADIARRYVGLGASALLVEPTGLAMVGFIAGPEKK